MINNNIKKILIIRLSAIGDTIHTLPSAYFLRENFPDAQIDWIVEDKSAMFILNNPLINNTYIIKRKNTSLPEFYKIISKIKQENYDVALDFQQLLKSALILGLSGAKRKITLNNGREFSWLFANEIAKIDKKLFDINYHVVKRNLDLASYLCKKRNEYLPKYILPDFSDEISIEIKNIMRSLDKTKKTIVLSPATTWENKHWTINGWIEVINEFNNSYNIIITAQAADKPLIDNILKECKLNSIINLTGKTNLKDLIYIFKNSDLIISPDSGSAHIAWAANAKAILTLFFATSKNRTAPYGKNYISLSPNISCSPCMSKKCKRKNTICTSQIKTEDVICSAKKLLFTI